MSEVTGALAAGLYVVFEFGGLILGPVVVLAGFLVDLALALLRFERPLSTAGAVMNGILLAAGAVVLIDAFYGTPAGETSWLVMVLLVLVLLAIPVNLALWTVLVARGVRTRRRGVVEPIPAVDA
jgi:hypothetical protein